MKTYKFILPTAAFLFAIVGMFVPNTSTKASLAFQDYYYDANSVCQVKPGLGCDNNGIMICKFKPSPTDIYRDVYESRVVIEGELTCQNVITHSLNNGCLN